MFQFELDKYAPTDRYTRKHIECYLCCIRKRLIKVTPEERVRQGIIQFLVTEKGFPIDNIRVEDSVTHYVKGQKGRVDIIIDDDEGDPLIIIECKEERELYTHNVKSQLQKYTYHIKPRYSMIVVGNQVYFEAEVGNMDKLVLLEEMPTYSVLINGGEVEYDGDEQAQYKRPIITEPYNEEEIDFMISCGYLGNNTSTELYPFILNFVGFMFDEENVLNGNNIKDLGIRVSKFGNAGGGSFGGEYRAFIYTKNEDSVIISLGLFGMYRSEDNYSSGGTSLMVAIDSGEKSHFSLQLRLDKYLSIEKGKFVVWHDGTMTLGNKGAVRRKDVLQYIGEHAPHLIVGGEIYLGEFDINEYITADKITTKTFINNLIEYALLRDKYRAKINEATK